VEDAFTHRGIGTRHDRITLATTLPAARDRGGAVILAAFLDFVRAFLLVFGAGMFVFVASQFFHRPSDVPATVTVIDDGRIVKPFIKLA
jgi:hypothetical protein